MVKLFSFEKNLWAKYNPLISSINQIEPELKILSDIELKERTKKLKANCGGTSKELPDRKSVV